MSTEDLRDKLREGIRTVRVSVTDTARAVTVNFAFSPHRDSEFLKGKRSRRFEHSHGEAEYYYTADERCQRSFSSSLSSQNRVSELRFRGNFPLLQSHTQKGKTQSIVGLTTLLSVRRGVLATTRNLLCFGGVSGVFLYPDIVFKPRD